MDFNLTEEQQLLIKSFKEMLDREVPESYVSECDRNHQPLEKFYEALVKHGYNMLGVEEKYGGTPVDYVTLMLLYMESAARGIPDAPNQCLQVRDIMEFGNPEQQAAILDFVKKTGKTPFALGITEPGAGSDDAGMVCQAKKMPDGTVVFNGQKTFITSALTSPYIMLMTRDLEAPDPHKAVSMWLVPLNLPGFTVKKLDKISWWTGNTCEVWLENVVAPQSCLMGKEGEGFFQLMKNFEMERLVVCASAAGAAKCAFEDAARYATKRVQFGQPIGMFQQVQLKLTEMYTKVENMYNMVLKTAWKFDHGMPVDLDTALCKRYCAMASMEVCDEALQIYGGTGLLTDCRVSRLWRDARIMRIGGGTDEIMVNIVGRRLFKMYK